MKMKEKIKEFNEDYKVGKDTFEDYCNTVAYIVTSLLKKYSFQYQIVSNRVKTFESIENKVVSGSLPDNITKLDEIDDIVGCRVIFYLESDIQKFESLIYNEFAVEKSNLRYSEDGYNALHLIVKLNPERLELMEYEKFSDLKCEIQLTTVLFHSWSQMSHNIIYKLPKELTEFDERSVNALKKEFGEVMKNHIKPASFRFEFINERFENLKRGKQIFDLDFLQSILFSNSRNEVYQKMKLVHQFLIEFGDKTPENFNLIEFISNVIEKSKHLETTDIKTGLGSVFGFEHHHVVEISLDILNEVRYFHVEETFKILMDLSQDEEQKIQNKSLEILNNLSKYNSRVIEKVGYYPQLAILNNIKGLSIENKVRLWKFLERLFSNLLNLEFYDYSLTDYNQIGVRFGAIGVNEHLKELRKNVIDILQEIYINSSEDEVKVDVIKVLFHVTSLPRRVNFDKEIEELVLGNIDDVVKWFLQNFVLFNLQEIKALDENIYRLTEKTTNLANLKLLIDFNPEYDIFKTLVGYDISYGREIGWREAEEIRRNKQNKYLRDISLESYDTWEKRILSIAQCYSPTKDGEFTNFKNFLFDLGKIQPDTATKLLFRNEIRLEKFLSNIVAGILTSKDRDEAVNQLILAWITNGKYLEQCANIYTLTENVNVKMLKDIYGCIVKSNNILAFYNLLRAVLTNKEYYQQLSNLFIKIIQELSKRGEFYWTHHIRFSEKSILDFLTDTDVDLMLSCLEQVTKIDFHEEELLTSLCKNSPDKIISFFERRVNIKIEKQKKSENQLIDNYDGVPDNFSDLGEFLRDKPDTILPLIIKWFNKEEWLFQLEASQLIKNIYPDFDDLLQQYLNKLIVNGNIEDANKVIQIIKEYEGSFKIHGVCKTIIKKHGGNGKLMQEIMSAVTRTGIVSGERGFIEAYERIKKEIRKWEKTNNQEIKKFAREFIRYIQPIITREVRRADRRTEMMKRRFNS
ncbi:hypothetical protein [Priestia sp. YIM B13486]|uniref:hypothetical protein n=1 Tax=Priestia sp. YIM B13486 TaxID=3366304 RepID=UPI00366FBAD4